MRYRLISREWTYGDKYLQYKEASYYMNGVEMSKVQQSTHLGIHRESSNKANITEKISLGRRTAYSVMGAGLHCGNGLKQCVGGKLWSTYVVPRLLYGLEVLSLSEKDFRDLELYQRKSLKQIQSFPDKTHSSAVLALLGILPLQRVMYIRTYSICFGGGSQMKVLRIPSKWRHENGAKISLIYGLYFASNLKCQFCLDICLLFSILFTSIFNIFNFNRSRNAI